MTLLKTISTILIFLTALMSPALAAENTDWALDSEPVTKSATSTEIVGQRWSMGAIKDDLMFNIHLDTSPDMLMGNWYGDIRSTERFYVRTYVLDEAGNKYYLKLNEVAAYGPDAEYGRWKKGAATMGIQTLRFDFSREELLSLKPFKSLIVNYGSFENPDDTIDITFSLENYVGKLNQMDMLIKEAGGDAFLLTEEEVNNMPINDLPAAHKNKWVDGVAEISAELSVPFSELMKLSINQITEKVEDKKTANREAAKAAKRAEHQAIYDQDPDWLDLNICPRPDVSYCQNVGMEAYENSILLGGDFSYGDIKGVVWRSVGSIIRIYGGDVDMDIDPEVYRAKTADYYYIVKKGNSQLDIRRAESLSVR